MLFSALLACTRPDPSDPRDRGRDDPDPSGLGSTTAETGTDGLPTGDTAVVPVIDCAPLVAPEDATWTLSRAFQTEEDFDFDGQGNLLTQHIFGLRGIDRAGISHFVAENVGPDATGIRSTSQGYVAVAQPYDGTVRLVDPETGGSLVLASGLSGPNGIEAGDDGMVYVTEHGPNGRIWMVDPGTGDEQVVGQAPWPNGIVLSPDERSLYVTSSATVEGSPTRIVRLQRDAEGHWDADTAEEVYVHPAYVGSLTIDACGNLYGLEYAMGRVFRLNTDTLESELFVELGPSWGDWSALHFSPGLDGWLVDALYVSDRVHLYEIPTGVPGSHVLAP